MKKIDYWGPFIDNVATVKAILNSSISINKYSKNFRSTIINVGGEWDNYKENDQSNFYDLNTKSFIDDLPKYSFIKSRWSYILIILKSFFPLKNYISKHKPEYLMIHLITSLPIALFIIFKFDTKLCLRISGLPKLNFFRKLLWKLGNNKIYKIFCPTIATMEKLRSENIFDKNKLHYLPDPIISTTEIRKLKSDEIIDDKFEINNIILIGRLTKQKNFSLFIDAFEVISKLHPFVKANIIGEGELKEILIKKIKEKKLDNKIKLLGYKKNIFKYLSKSKFFLLTSLWEDPGFVLVEAGFSNVTIISSNCPNGPEEILNFGKGGFIFNNNDKDSLINVLNQALSETENKLKEKKIICKKSIKKFSLFNHHKLLEKNLI